MAPCRLAHGSPLRDVLMDVKTLHYGSSTYPASEERCRAVARRAAAVDSDCLSKARGLDRRFFGTPDVPGMGP
eukprot:7016416-Karenia_brevis.AAC.1